MLDRVAKQRLATKQAKHVPAHGVELIRFKVRTDGIVHVVQVQPSTDDKPFPFLFDRLVLGVVLWARVLAGRLAGVVAGITLLSVGPLVLLTRTPTFYPLIDGMFGALDPRPNGQC